MRFTKWSIPVFMFAFLLGSGGVSILRASVLLTRTLHQEQAQQKTPEVTRITAEELKGKLTRNEPVAIVDVRATSNFAESETQIRGAVHVKLRRLKYRLGFPPLKNVPRDREIVTYCACPNDESAISAARILMDSGFTRVRALKGGWQEWLKISGQVERRAKTI